MEILGGIAIWIVWELLIDPVVTRLLRPLRKSLRSTYGGLVLPALGLGCGGWFWLAWQFGVSGEYAWADTAFVLTLLGAPACAMFSFLVWYHRNDPSRGPRGSAY